VKNVFAIFIFVLFNTSVFGQWNNLFTTNFNGDAGNWSSSTWNLNQNYPGGSVDGDNYIMYFSSGSAYDAYTFTEAVSMIAGNKYRIKYYYVRATANMNLEVRVGTAQNSASQTTVLETQFPVSNTTYNTKTNIYTPTTSGTYYFSFRTTGTGGSGQIGVDLVTVEENKPSEPAATIEEILNNNVIEPGDTIFVDAGAYTMGTNIGSGDDGSSSNDMVVYGAGSATVITAPTSDHNFDLRDMVVYGAGSATVITAPTSDHNFDLRGNYITIENLKMKSTQSGYYNVYSAGSGTGNKENNIKYCKLEHTADHNIYILNTVGTGGIEEEHFQIIGDTIENSAANSAGIYLEGNLDQTLIEDNEIKCTSATGSAAIYVTDNTTYYQGTTIIKHNILDIANYGVWVNQGGTNTIDFVKIIGNKIVNGERAISIENNVTNVVILNNYICSSNYAIYVDGSVNNNYIYHNSFYNSEYNVYSENIPTGSSNDWYIKNNIFYNTGSSISNNSCIYWNSSKLPQACNYNMFYVPNGASVGKLSSGITYSALTGTTSTDWDEINHQDNTNNGDANSFSQNPSFDNISACDLCPTTGFQTGENLSDGTGLIPEIEEDHYEEPRDDNTIGACEESTVLPVELLDFYAKNTNKTVELNWITLTEKNNEYFEIQRSEDGENFKQVGIVDGNGNSNTIISYQAIDSEIELNKTYYYRLKQVDYNEKYEYSKIISVNTNSFFESEISIYPNPSKGIFTIKANNINSIKIISPVGKTIKDLLCLQNITNYNVDLSNYPKGIYFIQITIKNSTVNNKLILK